MGQAKFIRIDEDNNGNSHTTEKHFDNSAPYEGLKPSEVIDVDCEDGQIREYYVERMEWDFSHFGDRLVITIRPCKRLSKLDSFTDPVSGTTIGIIKN